MLSSTNTSMPDAANCCIMDLMEDCRAGIVSTATRLDFMEISSSTIFSMVWLPKTKRFGKFICSISCIKSFWSCSKLLIPYDIPSRTHLPVILPLIRFGYGCENPTEDDLADTVILNIKKFKPKLNRLQFIGSKFVLTVI